MDLTELIERYGPDRVEKYFSLYMKSKYQPGGTANLVLDVLNFYLLDLGLEKIDTGIIKEEISDFFFCIYHFYRNLNVFHRQ
ncbi:9.7-kDa protein [Tetterwort vein chlorosis virus]|uniref:9.7-kDa protein n=1 Tax=Tetterwort vein chlorosis virus TaxID=1712389 RepID=A0A0M3TB51_9CLOS|nr:9.7-kDa protein [Tetterwort vein chlorosis virus]ALE18222.1 9.7-kDa protein [Tetterwort vein chlorosis virus]